FLEGKDSKEVLDFNLFLSKKDVWTAAIVPNGSGGASVVSVDKSCTIPSNTNFAPPNGVPFVNFVYASGGTDPDGGGDGLERTKEGYVELIEMATFATYTCTSIQVTHVGGVPFDCDSLSDAGAASAAFSAS